MDDMIHAIEVWGNVLWPEQSNMLYHLALGQGVLIDAGYLRGETISKIQACFDRHAFSLLLLTHGHRDHAEAATTIAERFGAAVGLHEEEPLPDDLSLNTIHLLNDGQRIALGAETLRVVHTPGHTRGHCCFYLERAQALFSGDLLLGEGTTWVGPPDGNMRDFMSSLARIATLPLRAIYPGHGPRIERPYERIQEVLAHRQMREAQVLERLEAGSCSLSALVGAIYPELPASRIPMAQLTVQAHVEKLVADQQVSVDGLIVSLRR